MSANRKYRCIRPCCRAGRITAISSLLLPGVLLAMALAVAPAMAETGSGQAQKRAGSEVGGRAIEAGGVCPLPDPAVEMPVCDVLQPSQCVGGLPGDTCLPQLVFFDTTGNPVAELCQCFPQNGLCGPVHVLPDPAGPGFRLLCDPNCPNGVDACTIHFDGVDTGQNLMDSGSVPPGALVSCDCAAGGPAPCPLPGQPIIPICDQNQAGGQCQTGNAGDTCLPSILITNDTGGFIAELCDCYPPSTDGICGPITVDGSVGFPVFSCVEACPNPPGGNCEIHINGVASGITSVPVFDVPPNSAVTCECAQPVPQLGACCFPDGTCAQVPLSDCLPPAIWHGVGSNCGPIGACCDLATGACSLEHQICCDGVWHQGDCQPLQACCLQDGTCTMLDPLCCVDLGGTAQGANSACSPSGPEACCFQDGTCAMLDPLCCAERGGTSQGAGSICLGDLNGNGVDDACETAAICPLPAPPAIPICQQQQQGSCIAGGVNDLCLPSMLFIDAAGQLQAEICQCFIPGNDCGPIDVQPLPGTNEILLTCNGLCPIPTDECLLHVGGISTGQAQDVASNMPAGAPITCQCTQPPPPELGACCFPDGTCAQVPLSDCLPPAIWHGVGSNCGPIGACCDLATGACSLEHQICCDGVWHQGDCQPLQACCLQDGTCTMLDPLCCVDLGGTAQGANSACSPSGPEACCFQDGTCAMLDPLCCAERGGTSQGAGSICLGDLNGNGVDDACETAAICPLPAPPAIPICQQQQQGSCIAGGVNDLCLPSMLFIDAAGQLQAEICQCFIPGNDCGPIGVEPLPGTNETLLSCNGLCPIPTDDCLLHVGGVSTGQAQDVLSNLPAGAPITCECTQPPPQNFCVYEITCADGDCSNCPAAAAGACFDAACPNNTCQVLAGVTTTCGGDTCCIEFGGFSCMDPAGLPPCPPLGNQCTCTPPQLGACCDILTGTCFDSFEADCPAPAIWQGAGTTCGPVGACCDPATGACSQQFEGCCNGVWHPGPCLQAARCCLGDSCIDIDPECCALMGGNAVSGTCQPTEACCFDDGTCADMDPVCCTLAGGNPQGAGSFCLGDLDGDGVDDACPPFGACCDLLFGTCTQTTQANCSGALETWLGAGSACLGDEACCFADGTCSVMDKACCLDSGGSPQGPGSTCTATGPEACCLPDDTCSMMDPRCCTAAGGSPQGVGSTCSATGPEACCQPNGVCTMLDPVCCLAVGGSPQGVGSTCTATGTQACCFANGSCAQMDPICCVGLGGLPGGLGSVCLGDGNGNGVDDACEVPQVCEPLDDGSGCTPVVCPPEACFGECVNGSYCDDPACCIDPAACQCYAPNSVVSINLCGDCFGSCTADGSYCDSGAPGCCIGGNCQCYSPNNPISIKLCGNCFGECIDGAYCDPVGNPACAIIPNQPACYDVFSQVSIDLCQSKPVMVDNVCETKCAEFDAANGAWGISVCDCVPVEECHVVLLPGADPFCDGVCPPETECVRNETIDPVTGNLVVCCDCEPIEACCMTTADVTCQQLPVSQCLAQGGTPQGPGSTCLGHEACCLPDGTCTFVDALCCDDLGGTPGGPGSTCLGEGACCLDIDDGPFQFDTCIIADEFCCETMGGVFQGIGSVCDTVACCLNGLCQDLDVECCLASGGVPQAAGSACEGDNNGNGVDDACEPDLCPLPLPPVIPICEQQQPGACIAGGPQDLCLPFIVFIDAAGQVQAEGCNCFSPGGDCGPIDVQPLPGTNETQLSCQGVCPAPDDDCLIHVGGISTGLSQVIAANMPAGQAISCECAVACPVPNPPLPEKKLATTCTSDADCSNLAVCVNGDCYVPKNKYISLRPGNAGNMVGLRVTMTSNALFPALVGQAWWVQPHAAADPPNIFRLGCSKHYQDWGTAPTVIHVGDRHITPQAVYEVQALTLGCDQTVPGNYSTPLVLPTVTTWGDCVGNVVAGLYTPPEGVVNLNDVFAAVLKFQGALSPNLVWVDVEGDVPNGTINIADVFTLVLAFQGGGYPYAGPLACQ